MAPDGEYAYDPGGDDMSWSYPAPAGEDGGDTFPSGDGGFPYADELHAGQGLEMAVPAATNAASPAAGPVAAIPPEIQAWAERLDALEGYPLGHAGRVADIATAIGRKLGLDAPDLRQLEVAALAHDAGELDSCPFLAEARELTPEERRVVRAHPVDGERLLAAWPEFATAARTVRWHHERWNGRGYPDSLRGEAIPLPARILAVADAYEAMVHERPYRPALGEIAAKDELRRQAGVAFDPDVVKACVAVVGPSVDEEILHKLMARKSRRAPVAG